MAKPHIRLHASAEGAARNKGMTAYDGASFTAHDVASWRPPIRSADAEILPERNMLVARSRDVDRNNPIARGARNTLVDNVVGTGPRLLSEPDYVSLGYDAKWSLGWSEDFENRFHAWFWSTACHAGDTQNGDLLTRQAHAAQIMNGDAVALGLWMPERGDGYATKLMMIEADRVSNPNGEPDSRYLRGGIKQDRYGMPLGMWVRNMHPGDCSISWTDLPAWEFVPRKTFFEVDGVVAERLNVIHFYDQERSEQSRGKPLMTTVLPELKNIDRYKRAEIDAAVANALIAGIITTPLGREDIIDLFSKDAAAYLKAREEHAVRLQSGSLVTVFPGDDYKGHIPNRPNASFGQFVKNVLGIAACGLDMPYELLTKDWSNTTYTSGRMALLEAWRSFNRTRDLLAAQWLTPIVSMFLQEQVHAGNIKADGFEQPLRRCAFLRCTWIFPGRGWVDEVKESTGSALRLANNTSTLARECAQQGLYWRDVMRQRRVEQLFAEELGLELSTPTAINYGSGSDPLGTAPADEPAQPKAPKQDADAYTVGVHFRPMGKAAAHA